MGTNTTNVNEASKTESLKILAEKIVRSATEADERTLEAAILIREARKRIDSGEAGDIMTAATLLLAPLRQPADSGPIKSQPESPDGLNVPNQDVVGLNDGAPDRANPQVERLLLPPETPLPPQTESVEAEAITEPEALAQAKERILARIWWLYADLKTYRENPSRRRRRELHRRFDNIFTTRTDFATLARPLAGPPLETAPGPAEKLLPEAESPLVSAPQRAAAPEPPPAPAAPAAAPLPEPPAALFAATPAATPAPPAASLPAPSETPAPQVAALPPATAPAGPYVARSYGTARIVCESPGGA